jgi:hypothetical protein
MLICLHQEKENPPCLPLYSIGGTEESTSNDTMPRLSLLQLLPWHDWLVVRSKEAEKISCADGEEKDLFES